MTRWALVGDSQAVGLTAPLREIARAMGAELETVATVGWTTRAVASDARVQALGASNPDLAIIVLGGNDTAGETYAARVRTLVALFSGAKRVIWIGPAHVTAHNADLAERKAAVAAQQSQLASALGFEWYDGRAMTFDLEHQPDGIHFRPSALAVWAQRIRARINAHPGATKLVVGGALVLGLALFAWWRLR